MLRKTIDNLAKTMILFVGISVGGLNLERVVSEYFFRTEVKGQIYSKSFSGNELYNDFKKINRELIYDKSKKENCGEVLGISLKIAQNYGKMNYWKFLKLHEDYLIKREGEIFLRNDSGEDFKKLLESPSKVMQFVNFLKAKRNYLLNEYVLNYRKKGFGGCVPISKKVSKFLKDFGIFSIVDYIPGHVHNLVNLEGVIYYVDFTFNQFVEKTVFTQCGPLAMKGKNIGLIIMPLGVVE